MADFSRMSQLEKNLAEAQKMHDSWQLKIDDLRSSIEPEMEKVKRRIEFQIIEEEMMLEQWWDTEIEPQKEELALWLRASLDDNRLQED
ncbi:hypothetical protein MAPG_04226 [Magnaporthiopsis poae ATCC 64411]|uniref:Uncharacterized protein n=1 Tax=Magnaporthiopsis poae (strain ATCC 64411 / 73-15) TaxID=644358 RepID=A0A0C4DW52_MAGP6|nr:hypothetical protein MAPG_04226 [Magnaporthiopsis poae ATCC 64411]